MVEAIAAAAELPVAQVRRAAMYSKSLGALARAALLEGADALGDSSWSCSRRLHPCSPRPLPTWPRR